MPVAAEDKKMLSIITKGRSIPWSDNVDENEAFGYRRPLSQSPTWWKGLVGVCGIGFVWLYFHELEARMMHHDEGSNFLFMESMIKNFWDFKYDPQNYHGPWLFYLGYFWSRVRMLWLGISWHDHIEGESVWNVRSCTVTAGLLILGTVALGMRNRLGLVGTAAAFIMLGLCTDIVWVSRYYIHEIYLTLFLLWTYVFGSWFADTGRPIFLYLCAFSVAGQFLTKEIAVGHCIILLLADICTKLAVFMLAQDSVVAMFSGVPGELASIVKRYSAAASSLSPVTYLLTALSFLVPWAIGYSSFGSNPGGLYDAFATYYYWSKEGAQSGHEKRTLFWVYDMLMKYEMTIWVTSVASFALAVSTSSRFGMFLSFWSVGMVTAYSIIPYKTSWCVPNLCLVLALLGGWGLNVLFSYLLAGSGPGVTVAGTQEEEDKGQERKTRTKNRPLVLTSVVVLLLGMQWVDVRFMWDINFVNWDDDKYPQPYVHIIRDMYNAVRRVEDLASQSPLGYDLPLNLLTSTHLHPLGHYIRRFNKVTWPSIQEYKEKGPQRHVAEGSFIAVTNVGDLDKVKDWFPESEYTREEYRFEPGRNLHFWFNMNKILGKPLVEGVLRAQRVEDASETLSPGLERREWRGMEWGHDGGSLVSLLRGVNDFEFDYCNGGHNPHRSPFSMAWSGLIYAKETGTYSFVLNSDDGSHLYIDGQQVVDNGGAHGVIRVEGSAELQAGYHKILIHYFDYVGGVIMSAKWKPPGAADFGAIPMDVLFHQPTEKKKKRTPAKMTLPTATGEHLPRGYYPQLPTGTDAREIAKKARFALLTAWDGVRYDVLGALVADTKAKYCALHGYAFFTDNDLIANVDGWHKKSAARIAVLNRHFDDGYEWVVWSDSDILMTNPRRTFDEIVDKWAPAELNKHVILTKDWGGAQIQTGTMFIKTSPEGREFIDQWAQAIKDHSFNDDLLGLIELEKANHPVMEYIVYTDTQGEFNPYAHLTLRETFTMDGPEHSTMHELWEEGDIMVHIVNCLRQEGLIDRSCCDGLGAWYWARFNTLLDEYLRELSEQKPISHASATSFEQVLRGDWSKALPSVMCTANGAQALSDESKEARKTSLLPYFPLVEEGTKQRFALLTAWDGLRYETLGALVADTKAKYCALHGYAFFTDNDLIGAVNGWHKKSAARIAVLNRHFDDGYEWVVWSDSDILMTNPLVTFDEIVDKWAPAELNKHVILTKDWGGAQIQTGTMFIKTSPEGREFIDQWAQAIKDHSFNDDLLGLIELEKANHPVMEYIVYTDTQGEFNPYAHLTLRKTFTMDGPEHSTMHELWEKGDIMVHIVNCLRQEGLIDRPCCDGLGAWYWMTFNDALKRVLLGEDEDAVLPAFNEEIRADWSRNFPVQTCKRFSKKQK